MKLIQFTADFDFTSPSDPYRTIAYKTGHFVEVTDECASTAIAAGCAFAHDDIEDDLDDEAID